MSTWYIKLRNVVYYDNKVYFVKHESTTQADRLPWNK